MALSPAQQRTAIRAALAYSQGLRTLFRRTVGSVAHPRGEIVTAFRKAFRSLAAGGLDETILAGIILQVYGEEVNLAVFNGMDAVNELASRQILRTAAAYGIAGLVISPIGIDQSIAAVNSIVAGQSAAINSGLLTEAQILGGTNRVGLFAPGTVQREAANQIAAVGQQTLDGSFEAMEQANPEIEFAQQAIAMLDAVTTPCCKDVAFQVRRRGRLFDTPLTPSYSSQQRSPPFHDYCRTTLAQVPIEAAEPERIEEMEAAFDPEGFAESIPF